MPSDLSLHWARAQLAPWPIGATLPAADRVDDIAADWIESGVADLTGRRGGPPIVPPGAAATAARGAEDAFRAVAAELGRAVEEIGWHRLLGERAALMGLTRNAPFSPGGACRALRTAGGWVAISLARPDDIAAVGALTGSDTVPVDADEAWATAADWAQREPAALVVEHAAVLGIPCGEIPPAGTWSSRPPAVITEIASGPAPQEPPLVLDFSSLWAGPLCAQLLSTAGARVVKVEFAGRLDGARRGHGGFYDLLHSGHDSVVIDGGDERLLSALLERADIVIEASRPRALAALGIDVDHVCKRSPTTWLSITAYGREHADRVGFGDDVAMSAGLVVRETPGGAPIPVGDALADPLTGMHGAVAALAGFCAGGSRLIDLSMRDVVSAASAWQQGAQDRAAVTGHKPWARPVPTVAAASPGQNTQWWRNELIR